MNQRKIAQNKMKQAFDHLIHMTGTDEFVLAGGIFANYYKNEEIRDFDLFFRDRASFELAKNNLELLGYRDNGERGSEGRRNSFIMEKDNLPQIDLILLEYLNKNSRLAQTVVENTDFTMSAVAQDKDGLVEDEHFFDDLINKRLRSASAYRNPEKKTSLRRIKKLYKKGFRFANKFSPLLHPMAKEARIFLIEQGDCYILEHQHKKHIFLYRSVA